MLNEIIIMLSSMSGTNYGNQIVPTNWVNIQLSNWQLGCSTFQEIHLYCHLSYHIRVGILQLCLDCQNSPLQSVSRLVPSRHGHKVRSEKQMRPTTTLCKNVFNGWRNCLPPRGLCVVTVAVPLSVCLLPPISSLCQSCPSHSDLLAAPALSASLVLPPSSRSSFVLQGSSNWLFLPIANCNWQFAIANYNCN